MGLTPHLDDIFPGGVFAVRRLGVLASCSIAIGERLGEKG